MKLEFDCVIFVVFLGLRMSASSEEDNNEKYFRDMELKYYKELTRGVIRVKYTDSGFKCPLCPGKRKQDYQYKELLQHVAGVGKSTSRSVKERASHVALERYILRHLDEKGRRLDEKGHSKSSKKSEFPPVPDGDHKSGYPRNHHDEEGPSEPYYKKPEGSTKLDGDQEFVYPWMGIIANIQTEWKNGKRVAESGAKLRDELSRKGFSPQKVNPIWSYKGHTGFAIVEFKNDWAGFNNAMSFEKSYEVEHCGKRNYYGDRNLGSKLYGWVARRDDYYARGSIGEHLSKNADLKTVSAKEAEDQRKASKLVSNLTNTLEIKSLHLKEMQNKYLETNASLNTLMEQKDKMLKAYNERMLKFSHFY